MENKKAILADPSEIIKTLDLEDFTIEGLDSKVKEILHKMDANLPDKLMVPMALLYVSSNLSNRTKFSEDDISMNYHENKPANIPGGPAAYKFKVDQTYLNEISKDVINKHV